MKKIGIITGCAGFIGINLTQDLLDKGWFIYGIDKLTYVANVSKLKDLQEYNKDNFKFINADISTLSSLPDCDVIFNLAAESDVDNSNTNCMPFIKSNVEGVANLLRLIKEKNTLKNDSPLFIQISTDEVYGDIQTGSFSEESPLNPNNPYAATKAAADMLIKSWHRTHNQPYIIIRPSNNYGYYQYPEKLIPLSVKNLNRGKKIKLHNEGKPIRTWTHVKDTIDAISFIYEKGTKNTIYNVSSGVERPNLYIVSIIVNTFFKGKVDTNDVIDNNFDRKGQDVRYSISCEPLKKLGWHPTKDLEFNLTALVNLYKENFTW